MYELPSTILPGAAVGTRLIARRDEQTPFTAVQETDARTALTRGLAEYLSQLKFDDAGGRQLFFERTYQSWAEPEDEAVYPAAMVSGGEGTYDDPKASPAASSNQRLVLPDGRYVMSPCEFVIDLTVDVRSTDPEARAALCAMLERDMNPVDWRYGVLLLLPHYFNQRGQYEMLSVSYADSEGEAQQRLRRAEFAIRARVPLTLLSAFPAIRSTARVTTT
jgi:hypothetical protein